MEIFDKHIRTPYDLDSQLEFEFDWLYQALKIASDHPQELYAIPEELEATKLTSSFLEYMVNAKRCTNDKMLRKELRPFRTVMAWHGGSGLNQVKYRLEPLLLTGAPYSVIAADLGGNAYDAKLIELYQRLFFNVRDDNGALNDSCFIRMRASLPTDVVITDRTPAWQLWRYAGTRYGYNGLVWMWGMPDPHGMLKRNTEGLGDDQFTIDELHRHAQAIMMENIIRGKINNFDLNIRLGHYMDMQRLNHDIGTGTKDDGHTFALEILSAIAPTALLVSNDVDVVSANTKALQGKFEAQKSVSGQSIDDLGPEAGEAYLKSMLDTQFKNSDA